MGKALYRKYRSKSLDEIVGQSHITDILKRSIQSDKIAHAYLLTGPRGVGKTSIARILAHEINGLEYTEESSHLDIIEIDAASHNGVEDIRDLREKAHVAPSSAKKKIYIIDEVHMLSKSAFNALLKTLEEPPEHVVFVLATTDMDKLPATIVSRVQQFHFRPIAEKDVVDHLKMIAKKEHIKIDDDALRLVAQHGGGSFRDSISLLDQLSSLSDDTITPALIESLLGLADAETISKLLEAYDTQDLDTIVKLIHASETHGTPATQLANQLITRIQGSITEKPALLPLLDELLDVQKSTWPRIKLLVSLSKPIQSTYAPAAPQQRPKAVAAAPQKTVSSPAPSAAKQKSSEKDTQLEEKVKEAVTIAETTESTSADKPLKTANVVIDGAEFPWKEFMAAVKEDSMGAATILLKCGHEFDGAKLIIYAGKAFQKNKLDKNLPELQKAIQSLGIKDIDIVTLAEPKPASDSQTAAVLAMMGGGEEVSL